jgi:hypothetical protein
MVQIVIVPQRSMWSQLSHRKLYWEAVETLNVAVLGHGGGPLKGRWGPVPSLLVHFSATR